MWEHSTLVVSVRLGQVLVVDVSFKDRYDTLTEVTRMVIVRLDLNPEVIMDTGSCTALFDSFAKRPLSC